MIKALIFDMDGTLVDSEKLHFEAWREILIRHGVGKFPFEEFIAYVGTSNEKLAGDYIVSDAIPCSVEELVLEKQKIYLEMIPGIEPLPGVVESIGEFHGKYRLAVASSSHLIELEKILKTIDLRHCFEAVVGGDMVERKKPDPEIYLKTRDLLGLASDECVAFEDSESGLAAAKNGGLFGIAIPNVLSKHHDFSRADQLVERMDMVDDPLLKSLI